MRKGSLEYWPHRRAKKIMPRIRTWPAEEKAAVLGFVGFKAGMTHVMLVDDSEGPAKGTEVAEPVTIVEVPPVFAYGARFYAKSANDSYLHVAYEVYDEKLAKNVGINKTKHNDISAVKDKLEGISDITLLAYVNPSGVGFGTKKHMRFELALGGTLQDKLALVEKVLGKEIKISEIFKPGDYVDVTSISKGKGWEGPVRRFGVARQFHKATGKVRHVGTLGPFHPPKVLYSVPMAGHLGHNYRTELNKRVLKVGSANEAKQVNVAGGFPNYGVVKNDFVVLHGSLPGAPGMLVRLRKTIRQTKPSHEPVIKYISVSSKIGA